MNCVEKWTPVAAMVTVEFGIALLQILFKKSLNGGMDHVIIVVYRQSISTIFLIPFVYFWERSSWAKLTTRLIGQMFLCALVGLTLTQYLFLVGLDYTSATFTCAFINMVPVITFVLALPLGMEKVNMKKNSGSLAWSSWFLTQSKIGHNFPYQYSSTSIMSFFSAIQSVILCFITDRNTSKWILKGELQILSVIYGGIVGSGLCYVAMSWCVKQRGPVFTAAFSPLVQIFTAVFDVLVLHEEIYLGSVLGSIVVIVGMYVLLWGKSINDEESCSRVPKRMDGCNGQDSAHQVASH
ncbi:hypothetical protein DH2020_002253 [Rehmannia glutinosa]|uniref:WAT1-related protein n=1 Tax=Rehmannia glutinosa TaxID=99300 RepID=A0ABR0XT80_REHGL